MPADLTTLLLDAGLLQFGWFADTQSPFQLRLELLSSYPDILAQVVECAVPLVGEVDHLVCVSTAVPLGVGISLATGLPLVYSRDRGDSPVNDLVGAYDIGHPALLLANDLRDASYLMNLVNSARRVGLEIERVLVIMDDSTFHPSAIPITGLIDLEMEISRLVKSGHLPSGHGDAVSMWIQEQRRRVNHRPD